MAYPRHEGCLRGRATGSQTLSLGRSKSGIANLAGVVAGCSARSLLWENSLRVMERACGSDRWH